MEDLINMVEGLFEMLESVITFVIDWIKDILYVGELLGTIVLNLPDIFGWMPLHVFSLISSIFGVIVIYKILGREG